MQHHFTMKAPSGFNFRTTVDSHGWRDLPPFSYDPATRILSRIQQLPSGKVILFTVQAAGDSLLIQTNQQLKEGEQAYVTEIVGRVLWIDLELDGFYQAIDGMPEYDWVPKIGAGRLLISPTVWEDLAKTLLTTNTTWSMTKAMCSRLCELGTPHPDGSHAFPTPEAIAALSPDELADKLRAGYRNAYLHELATRIASGELDVEAWYDGDMDSVTLYKTAKSLKGFGDYAAGTMTRLLGHFDKLAIDTVCHNAYAHHHNGGVKAPVKEITAHYGQFGRWQGLIMWMDVLREYGITNYDS